VSTRRRELARIGLPLSTYTQWYWKIDLHNLLHFLALRCDEHAQQEIRLYAQTIGEEIVAPLFPAVWEAFVDFRRNALQLTGPEVQVVQRLATRARLDPSAPWTEADFLTVQDPAWAPLVRCRERDECRSKLVRLGLLTPPIEVPAPPA
jgi:thymidylate synthase (FAD)